MQNEAGEKLLLGGAMIAAVTASLCCILPVVAIAFGVGAFGIASTFESIRPYMLAVVAAALAFSFYRVYFRRQACSDGQACSTKPIRRINELALWTATAAVIGIAAFPHYSSAIVSALDTQPPTAGVSDQAAVTSENKIENLDTQITDETAAIDNESENRKTTVIAVDQMTCEGCASQLNVALKRQKGVISAEASYANKNVRVVYNPKQITIEKIKEAIRNAGYDPR